MVIGISGRMRAGKDTVAGILVEQYGFRRIAFADKLKQSAAASLGISVEELERLKTDENKWFFVESSNSRWGDEEFHHPFTTREYLQRYGSEAHRDVFGENFWVDQALTGVNRGDRVAVSDVRFPNEARKVKELGGIILRVRRKEADDVPVTHASEQDLSEFVDVEIENNGTIEELREVIAEQAKNFFGSAEQQLLHLLNEDLERDRFRAYLANIKDLDSKEGNASEKL